MPQIPRRQALRLFATLGAVGAAAPVLSACGRDQVDAKAAVGPVRIGLLVPQSGVYQQLGTELTKGFELYWKRNGNKLGGYRAELFYADEGETAESGRAAAEKLVKQDKVLTLSGIANSATMLAVKDLVESSQVPLVGAHASPTNLSGVKYIWRTSCVDDEPGTALGRYVAERHRGGAVFLIAADYQAGRDAVAGFLRTFTTAGGRTESIVYTPFTPKLTTDYAPYLNQIRTARPKAVFCSYAGAAAERFVRQYAEAGLRDVPLYAPGYLTEGPALLKAQGDAANNIYTSMNYSPGLDNPANRRFAADFHSAYNAAPTTYAMSAYDAAGVLDQALRLTEGVPTPQALNAAIGTVGQVDSPRGPWQFTLNGTPLQKWYLRQVRLDGTVLHNGVVAELTTLPGPG